MIYNQEKHLHAVNLMLTVLSILIETTKDALPLTTLSRQFTIKHFLGVFFK